MHAHLLGPLVTPNYFFQRRNCSTSCDTHTLDQLFGNADLVARILTGSADVKTYVAARAVSKVWNEACSRDEALLRAVACSAGSLTKRDFMGLLRLQSAEADEYPRELHRRPMGWHYYLYDTGAFDAALKKVGGMPGLNARRPPLLTLPHRKRHAFGWKAKTPRIIAKRQMRRQLRGEECVG